MVLNDIHNLLDKKVFPVPSSDLLFNQYRERDLKLDQSSAPEIRKENLVNYLRSFSNRPTILIVGEAPGPRGCRFSGVPFTSEAQICDGKLPFTGSRSSNSELHYSEVSATVFWRAMLPYHPKFLIWNSIPFHPHKHEEFLSIRNPTRDEVCFYAGLLEEMISLVKPEHIVAVGKKAEYALKQKKFSCIYIRHPSHGGAIEFSKGIKKIFGDL